MSNDQSIKISFVGDIMLGRFVGEKYAKTNYNIVDQRITDRLRQSDCVIANLESPVLESETQREDDHLRFFAEPAILKQFDWVGCFSLSNNHINDCGTVGMDQTTALLNGAGLKWNGLYREEYTPFFITSSQGAGKIAVITCDDLMNYEFDKDCPWKTLRIGDEQINRHIDKYKRNGYFVIVYAHVGMLFTRFPSPSIRTYLHTMVDAGADLIVTVHAHVAGGMEYYRNVPIFHSLGDFVMDGSSFRRRRNYILNVNIQQNRLVSWNIQPTIIDMELRTVLPDPIQERKQEAEFRSVSKRLALHSDHYKRFYKRQYRKEMLAHSFSTIHFLYRTKGLFGLFRLLRVRIYDVMKVAKGVVTDRSNMRYDSDAVSVKHKLSNEKLK